MSNLFKGVRCLTQEQYEELKTNGTITIDGETYLFEEDWLYVTPEDVSGIARNNKKRLDSLSKDYENTKLVVAENKNNITLLKSNYTTISNDLNDVKTDINNLIATSVTLDGVQTITGPKTFTENIYLANADGTVDRISHINNNFIIYSGAENGVALLNIDEGLDKIYAFNKELAFKEDLTDSGGSKVYVSGELKESVSFDEDPQTQITQNTNYINESKKSIAFAEEERQKTINLCSLKNGTHTNGGVTAVYNAETQTITLNGTASTDVDIMYNSRNILPNIINMQSKTVTASLYFISGSYSGHFRSFLGTYDNSNIWSDRFQLANFENGDLTTHYERLYIPTNLTYDTLMLYCHGGTTFNNLVLKVQFVEGENQEDWHYPYGTIVHEKDIEDVEHIETIYDRLDSNKDFGYTAGLTSGDSINVDLSKYKYLIITVGWIEGNNMPAGTLFLDLNTPHKSDAQTYEGSCLYGAGLDGNSIYLRACTCTVNAAKNVLNCVQAQYIVQGGYNQPYVRVLKIKGVY